MANQAYRVRDLPQQTGKPGPHALLLCWRCGGEYSANSGDYFMADPDTVLKCCNRPMALVTKHIAYKAA